MNKHVKFIKDYTMNVNTGGGWNPNIQTVTVFSKNEEIQIEMVHGVEWVSKNGRYVKVTELRIGNYIH